MKTDLNCPKSSRTWSNSRAWLSGYARLRLCSSVALALAGSLLWPGSNAKAATTYRAFAGIISRDAGVESKAQDESGVSKVPVSRVAFLGGQTGGQASATVDTGVIKVRASATAQPPLMGQTFFNNALASASATVDTVVTILNPALAGIGTIRAVLYIDRPAPVGLPGGVANHSGLGDASANAFIGIGKPGQPGWLAQFGFVTQSAATSVPFEETSVNLLPVSSGSGFFELELPLAIGEQFKIQMTGVAFAKGEAGPFGVPASADADLGNSLYWGGFSSLTIGGVTTSDFTALDQAGNDWKRSYIPPSVVPILPRLEIQSLGATLRLSWPATAGIILERTDPLTTTGNWTSLPFTVTGETAAVEVDPTTSAGFFRLRKL